MSEWQLHELSDLRELAIAATNIIVSDFPYPIVLLSTQRVFDIEDDLRVGSHDAVVHFTTTAAAVLLEVHDHHFELHCAHASTSYKHVASLQGTEFLLEVWLHVHLEDVSGDALDGVGEGRDGHALGVLYVVQRADCDGVPQSQSVDTIMKYGEYKSIQRSNKEKVIHLRLERTTLVICILDAATVSSLVTTATVVLRFLPFSSTVSPSYRSNSFIFTGSIVTIEWSSATLSSTRSVLGEFFFCRIAVARSVPGGAFYN